VIHSIRSVVDRLLRGDRWAWRSSAHRDRLPSDLEERVMAITSADRFHAKQGRSTCRVRLDGPGGSVSAYLKRHERLPWRTRLAALAHPAGRHTPAGMEWRQLRKAEAVGFPVPEPLAAGERIGPWGTLSSYLLIRELEGYEALHEAIPQAAARLDPAAFAAWKRRLTAEVAALAARLHNSRTFHKDLYLCHFFLNEAADPRLVLIDFHRVKTHRLGVNWWRWKDLGQLLFSTFDVAGITDRDRLRFWTHYRRLTGASRWQARPIRWKAARYLDHQESLKG